jgi:hypothetical protein
VKLWYTCVNYNLLMNIVVLVASILPTLSYWLKAHIILQVSLVVFVGHD